MKLKNMQTQERILRLYNLVNLIIFLPMFIIGMVFLLKGLNRNSTPGFQIMMCPTATGDFVSVKGDSKKKFYKKKKI